MSITDELRKWVRYIDDNPHLGSLTDFGKQGLRNIADRIDEAHEKAEKNALSEYIRGYNTGFDVAADEVESTDELRERIEREYIKLPVDADGKVIHVEDEVELLDGSKRFKAEWLEWDGEDWVVHETIGYGVFHEPSALRHVQPDSWERIIEDAISECGWEQPKEYEIDFEDSKEARDRFVAELVERCKRLAGE